MQGCIADRGEEDGRVVLLVRPGAAIGLLLPVYASLFSVTPGGHVGSRKTLITDLIG